MLSGTAQVPHDADTYFREGVETFFCRLAAPIQLWSDLDELRYALKEAAKLSRHEGINYGCNRESSLR